MVCLGGVVDLVVVVVVVVCTCGLVGAWGHCCYYIELISLNNASSHVYSHTLRACLYTHG